MKNVKRINESQLRAIVAESVKKVLKEDYNPNTGERLPDNTIWDWEKNQAVQRNNGFNGAQYGQQQNNGFDRGEWTQKTMDSKLDGGAYIEGLLQQSYEWLQKLQTEYCKYPTQVSQIASRVMNWISTAKSYLMGNNY